VLAERATSHGEDDDQEIKSGCGGESHEWEYNREEESSKAQWNRIAKKGSDTHGIVGEKIATRTFCCERSKLIGISSFIYLLSAYHSSSIIFQALYVLQVFLSFWSDYLCAGLPSYSHLFDRIFATILYFHAVGLILWMQYKHGYVVDEFAEAVNTATMSRIRLDRLSCPVYGAAACRAVTSVLLVSSLIGVPLLILFFGREAAKVKNKILFIRLHFLWHFASGLSLAFVVWWNNKAWNGIPPSHLHTYVTQSWRRIPPSERGEKKKVGALIFFYYYSKRKLQIEK